MIYAYDFESYYDKNYSIRDLGNWGYTHHPEFDAYLLAVAGDDGYRWVGNPKNFDWSLFQGATLIAHNMGFDLEVLERLRELGIVPKNLRWKELFDTADLAAYCGYPRSLAEASAGMLGIKVDKGPRDKAKGKHWKDMTPEFQEQMKTYALAGDAVNELNIWLKWNHLWPEWERELSRLTRDMCRTGVPVNKQAVEKAIAELEILLWKTRSKIPWSEDPDAAVLSPKAAAEECRKNGITPPKSMAKDSEEFTEWLRQHGDALPWAKAMGSYRSINNFLKKLTVMRDRTKETGWMPVGLKYFGAHTGRDSGDAGFNPLNLPREPMFAEELSEVSGKSSNGIDIRGLIEAPEGKILGVVDQVAIEPCCLAVLSGDQELVELLHKGYDPYEAHARVTGAYTDDRPLKEVDPELRKYEKVQVLGMGYGAGPDKIVIITKQLADLVITRQKAIEWVTYFRARKFIPNLWTRLERTMRLSAPGDFELELPSGRVMKYREVKNYHGLTAAIPRLGRMMRLGWWGGSITENLTQSTARDVFVTGVLGLHAAGLPPILRVYDEVVCLLDEATAEEDLKRMITIMSTPPAWMPELPIQAEGHLCRKYQK